MKRSELVKAAVDVLRSRRKPKLAGVVYKYLARAASAKQIADTIAEQLGGYRRLRMMTGAKNFSYGSSPPSLNFTFPNKAAGKPNALTIEYNVGRDTYDMEFKRVRGSKVKTVKTYNNVYADQLKELFEKTTGLYLSFR